jgi:hypothetical protein
MPECDVTVTATFTEIPIPIEYYSVTITASAYGSVTANKTTGITEGETITLNVSPTIGYELSNISAHKTGDPATSVTLTGSSNTGTFTMPAFNVTVVAKFEIIPVGEPVEPIILRLVPIYYD